MTALVIKLGGDALATPERIAAAARRIAVRRAAGPVVAVASARRGVTDHLLGLVEAVRQAGGAALPTRAARSAADRAVTSGEIVSASLLAVALEDLGVPAAVLDGREAGLLSDGTPGEAALLAVRTARIERLIARGTVPVVTGFQAWHRGRVSALGRGGSDITALALARALHAEACELVKDPGALHTADPRLLPKARPIPIATHRFLSELAAAGARVVHHAAALEAERERIPLRLTSLHHDGEPATIVGHARPGTGLHAVVLASGYRGFAPADDAPSAVTTVSAVLEGEAAGLREELLEAGARSGVKVLRTAVGRHGLSFLLPAERSNGETLLRTLHVALERVAAERPPAEADDPEWRGYAAVP